MLSNKINPDKLKNMTPRMCAISGYILNKKYTSPQILAMITTKDDFVLAWREKDIGYNEFIGSLRELGDEWEDVLDQANLTSNEYHEAIILFNKRICI